MLRAGFLLAGVSLSVVFCPEARAQQGVLRIGQPVRVEWMEGPRRHRVVGTALELPTDSVVVQASPDVWRFALAGKRVDVRVPRSTQRGVLRGAGIGALIGFGLGLAVGGIGVAQCGPGDEFCVLGLIVLPPLGVLAGLPLGAIVGAIHPGQRWQPVR
jgi:hypothetical protein